MITDPNLKLTVLKLLAGGRDPDFAAAATGTNADDVVTLGEEYGWPDPERLRWSVDELARQARVAEREAIARPATPAQRSAPAATVRRLPVRPPAQPPAPAAVTPPKRQVSDPAGVEQLLERADALTGRGTARARQLAHHLRSTISKLSAELDQVAARKRQAAAKAEAEARAAAERAAAREKAAQERREAREKVERLRAELALAQAALKRKPISPAAKKASTKTVSAVRDRQTARLAELNATIRDVRAWCRDHGVECPASGSLLPAAVLDAYTAAHPVREAG